MEWFVDNEESFKTLTDIVNSRIINGVFEYEVCWSDGTKNWVVKHDFEDDEIEVQAFHNGHPNKPFPTESLLERNSR